MQWLRKRAIWCWDNADRLAYIGALVMSGIAWAWTAYVSAFLKDYAPLSWVASGTLGILLAAVIWALGAWGYSRAIIGRRTAEIINRTHVNPLETRFERQEIRLADFYDPQSIPHRNKDFRDCKVSGPGIAAFPGCSLNRLQFRHVQIVITNPQQRDIFNVTVFEDSQFVGGSFSNLTMLMTREHYNALPAEMRANVLVISEMPRG